MPSATATAEAPDVAWAPFAGSQVLFLSCPHWELLYTGTRGPGKSDALIMDFAQHVGQGWGADWRGVLFRHEYKPLAEIVRKSEKWFRRIFPHARFLRSQGEYRWVWPDGEELLLRSFKKPSDYWDYHGHEYPWIGWEELTSWASGECYHVMKSCNRSSRPGIPRKYRATCNPYGPGHNWVKAYFVDPAPAGEPFTADRSDTTELAAEYGVEPTEDTKLKTVCLHGHYSENTALMEAQPDYPAVIAASAANPEQAKAWLSDDWDIVAGGMFDDVWKKGRVLLEPFAVPRTWRLDRSYDWGASKPFSVGWWAEHNGEGHVPGCNCPRGSIIRVGEWYGWDGKTPNVGLRMTDKQVAQGIVQREKAMGIAGRVRPGPADSMIFYADPGRKTIADIMRAEGVRFIEADKRPGSRKPGWSRMREMLKAASGRDPETPHLHAFSTCRQFARTVPTLPRSENDPDDVDSDAEDHVGDEVRYRCTAPKREAHTTEFRV